MIMIVYGQNKAFGNEVPQLALDRQVAQIIASYSDVPGATVSAFEVTLHSPCKSKDVAKYCDDLGFKADEHAVGEWLSWNPLGRIALQNAGFDGFADMCDLENTSVFQVVAFNPSALKEVNMA